jgi:hypothetical protein
MLAAYREPAHGQLGRDDDPGTDAPDGARVDARGADLSARHDRTGPHIADALSELVNLGRTDDSAAEDKEDSDDGAAGALVPVAC